jgi:hypothetical protein
MLNEPRGHDEALIAEFLDEMERALGELGLPAYDIAMVLERTKDMLTGCGRNEGTVSLWHYADLAWELGLERRKRINGEKETQHNHDGRWN